MLTLFHLLRISIQYPSNSGNPKEKNITSHPHHIAAGRICKAEKGSEKMKIASFHKYEARSHFNFSEQGSTRGKFWPGAHFNCPCMICVHSCLHNLELRFFVAVLISKIVLATNPTTNKFCIIREFDADLQMIQ